MPLAHEAIEMVQTFAAQAGIAGTEHLAHAAGAEGCDDFVGAEAGTTVECHRDKITALRATDSSGHPAAPQPRP